MSETKRIFVTDCEGPVSKNDNAFELACYFIPEGEKFFTQISRYDDVQADIVKRKGYKAGDTLKLIVPFLKAYEVTDKKMEEFSARNVLAMPGAEETLQFLANVMPSFIVSTSYEHYIKTLCRVLGFPFENTYCTSLNIDTYTINEAERKKLKQFRREICTLPLIEVLEKASSLEEISEKDQQTIRRLDEIFWREIMQMESGKMLREVNPVGGVEKAKAVREIVEKYDSDLSSVIYVGDSITDIECFRLVKKNDGLTVSFNGNAYAIREAEIAILSTNLIVVAVIADVFRQLGKDSVFEMVDEWRYESLRKYDVSPFLQKMVHKTFPKKLPKIIKITTHNMIEITAESSAFRKLVRGEKVGGLG